MGEAVLDGRRSSIAASLANARKLNREHKRSSGTSEENRTTDISGSGQSTIGGDASSEGTGSTIPGGDRLERTVTRGSDDSNSGIRGTGRTSDGDTTTVYEDNEDQETEASDQSLLKFPPEAYYSTGKKAGEIKKSWREKFSGSVENKTPKPDRNVKTKGVSLTGDKALFERVTEGFQYGFDGVDLFTSFGLGVPSGIWTLSKKEAEVFARILIARADKGDKAALKVVASISNNMDLLEAAIIVIPRTAETIREVAKNGGVKPNFSGRSKEIKE